VEHSACLFAGDTARLGKHPRQELPMKNKHLWLDGISVGDHPQVQLFFTTVLGENVVL